MAEIILPPEENEETPQVPELNIDKPTENSKVITIEFEAKKTNKVSTKDTKQQLYTTDTDAWFEFKETSLEGANGTYSVVFRNGHDGSIFQRTGDVVNGVAYYKIPHQEIRHAGDWRGQLVYTLSNGDTTAREFEYDVKGHILDGEDVREIVIEDFETLMAQLRSMKDSAELELASLKQELRNTTDTAEQNETDRQVFFDDLVEDIDELQANYRELLDTGVLQTNINTKLEALEEEYAPKLTEVTAQLAQTNNLMNGKADKTYVDTAIENIDITDVDLTDYATLNYVNTAIENIDITDVDLTDYATLNYVNTAITNIDIPDVDLTDYATLNYVNDLHDSTTAQLAQTQREKVGGGVKANLEDLSSNVLSAIEGGEGTSFDLLSIPQDKSVTPKKTTFITGKRTINLFNRDTMTKGFVVAGGSGEVHPWEGYAVSDYISVKGGKTYTSNLDNSLGNAFYDVDKNFIVGDTLQAPENAVFLRQTTTDPIPENVMLVEGSKLPDEYVPYTVFGLDGIVVGGESIGIGSIERKHLAPDVLESETGGYSSNWQGKTWNILGDSISTTDYTSKAYYEFIQEDKKFAQLNNYGVSGTEISSGGDNANPFVERISNMAINADLITVFGGVNDFLHNVPLGEMSSRTNDNFFGALHNLMSILLNTNLESRIGFITPMQSALGYDSDIPNSHGLTLDDYRKAILEVAEFYSLPVLDLYAESGITPKLYYVRDKYMPDGLHLNSLGHEVIATKIGNFIETL